ncbi:hypothetical protein NE462_27850, partial [Blautia hominis]|nr:hypothetical protein [Blautia hominis]
LYLTAVIDWYSRCIVGWEVDDTLDTRMVINALKKAFKTAELKGMAELDCVRAAFKGRTGTSYLGGQEIIYSVPVYGCGCRP